MDICKDIFKAYDIRGLFSDQLTLKTTSLIATALSSIYKDKSKIIVGRDGRLSSESISKSLIEGFINSGRDVIDIGLVPTPVLYFAVQHFKSNAGVMITGSHNPKEYNGLKIIMDNHSLAGEEINNIYKTIISSDNASDSLNLKKIGNIDNTSVNNEYCKEMISNLKITKPLKSAIDAGNGAAGPTAKNIYKSLGCEVLDFFCDIDGNFPNHHPNPSIPENLETLQKQVILNKCDLGIAFDGDGDRCAIVDDTGKIIWPDRQMMIFSRDLLQRKKGSKIIYDVKSSKHLPDYIKLYGGDAIMCRTGHSFIKKKMNEVDALLAGEMSGHIFFKEDWFGFDDGIYAGAKMIEIISNQKDKSSVFFSDLPSSISTPEINIPVFIEGEQHKFIEDFVNNAKFPGAEISKIDGLRADFDYGWGLIRASNTTPCLVTRFEADTEENLSKILNMFRIQIYNINKNLEIPYGKE